MAIEFKGTSTVEEQAALESETQDMMKSVCASSRGETPVFSSTCAKLQTSR